MNMSHQQFDKEQLNESKHLINNIKIDDSPSDHEKSQLATLSIVKIKTDTLAESFCLSSNQHISTIKNQFQQFIAKVQPEKKIQILLAKNLQQKGIQFSLNENTDEFCSFLNSYGCIGKLLDQAQRKQFQHEIERYNLFAQTLKLLYESYHPQLYNEILYCAIFFYKHFLKYAEQHPAPQQIFPHIVSMNSINFDLDNFQLTNYKLPYQHLNVLETLTQADKVATEYAKFLFCSKELRLINLLEFSEQIPKLINLEEQFSKFMKVLARSVFLSLIEVFDHPDTSQRDGKYLKRWAQVSIFDWSQESEEIEKGTDSFNECILKKRKIN